MFPGSTQIDVYANLFQMVVYVNLFFYCFCSTFSFLVSNLFHYFLTVVVIHSMSVKTFSVHETSVVYKLLFSDIWFHKFHFLIFMHYEIWLTIAFHDFLIFTERPHYLLPIACSSLSWCLAKKIKLYSPRVTWSRTIIALKGSSCWLGNSWLVIETSFLGFSIQNG